MADAVFYYQSQQVGSGEPGGRAPERRDAAVWVLESSLGLAPEAERELELLQQTVGHQKEVIALMEGHLQEATRELEELRLEVCARRPRGRTDKEVTAKPQVAEVLVEAAVVTRSQAVGDAVETVDVAVGCCPPTACVGVGCCPDRRDVAVGPDVATGHEDKGSQADRASTEMSSTEMSSTSVASTNMGTADAGSAVPAHKELEPSAGGAGCQRTPSSPQGAAEVVAVTGGDTCLGSPAPGAAAVEVVDGGRDPSPARDGKAAASPAAGELGRGFGVPGSPGGGLAHCSLTALCCRSPEIHHEEAGWCPPERGRGQQEEPAVRGRAERGVRAGGSPLSSVLGAVGSPGGTGGTGSSHRRASLSPFPLHRYESTSSEEEEEDGDSSSEKASADSSDSEEQGGTDTSEEEEEEEDAGGGQSEPGEQQEREGASVAPPEPTEVKEK